MSILLFNADPDWSPRRIAGLQSWIDFSDEATVTTATGISFVQDKSGKGNHVSQATGARQPIYNSKAAGINNLRTAEFTSAALALAWSGTNGIGQASLFAGESDRWSVFVVYQSNDGSTFGSLISRQTGTGEGTCRISFSNADAKFRGTVRGTATTTAADGLSPDPRFVSTTWDGTTCRLRLSDGSPETLTIGSSAGQNVPCLLGARWDNFSLGTILGQLIGKVGEVLIFNTHLSDTDRQLIAGYLAWKWGLYVFAGVEPPLDNFSAAAAYSVRKLRTAYTGSAIRVRRSSDNAEQDIGFTAGGDLDTTALLAFTGVGDGFVVTWYDQSGNAPNAVQGTASKQPQIVSSGVMQAIGGRPALNNQSLRCMAVGSAPVFRNTSGATIASVSRFTTPLVGLINNAALFFIGVGLQTGSSRLILNLNPASGTPGTYSLTGRRLDNDTFTTANSSTQITNAPQVWISQVNYGTAQVSSWLNGAADIVNTAFQTAGSTSDTDSAAIGMFASGNGGTLFAPNNTFLSEGIFINSVLSTADRQALEQNQGAYYGIPIT